MKSVLYSLGLLQCSLMALGASIKNLVVFGDSNSDVGNNQRWSNGPLWSEYIAVGWDIKLYSFAFSGAVCDNDMYDSVPEEDRIPSIKDQIEGYYNLKLNLNPEETVYAFWFGIHDLFEMAKRHGNHDLDYKLINNCIDQQLKAVRKVFLSDRFLVFNVPPLEFMPYYRDSPEAANHSHAAIEINRSLEKEVTNLNKHHHALQMDYVDVHSLVKDLVVDPLIFGFKDANLSYIDTCYEQSSCTYTADDYVWWDQTHFTTAFYKSIATSILEKESFMTQKSSIETNSVIKKLEASKSKYRSKKYQIEPNTDTIDLLVKQYDSDKLSSLNSTQQETLDDILNNYPDDVSHSHAYLWIFLFLTLVLGIVAWIKLPRSVLTFMGPKTTRSRINFTVIRNEDA